MKCATLGRMIVSKPIRHRSVFISLTMLTDGDSNIKLNDTNFLRTRCRTHLLHVYQESFDQKLTHSNCNYLDSFHWNASRCSYSIHTLTMIYVLGHCLGKILFNEFAKNLDEMMTKCQQTEGLISKMSAKMNKKEICEQDLR